MNFEAKLSRLRAAVALVALIATPTLAHAQTPERQPSLQEKESARKLLDQGRAAEANGDLPAAIERYRAADAIMGAATTGIYLAKALAKNGQLIEARDVALRTSREPKLPNERPERTLARDEAAKLLAELGPRVPSITLSARPASAPSLQVVIDGKLLPSAVVGQPWSVDPGSHGVTVTAAGFEPRTVEVVVKESESREVQVDLVPSQATAAPRVVAPPPPPPHPPPVTPAREDDGVEPAAVVAITGLSVGGAGLVVGAVTGGLSLAKTSSIQDACRGTSCPPSLASDGEDAQLLATASNVAFAVGGAFTAAGLVGVIVMSSSGGSESVAVTWSPTGLGLSGRF